MADYFGDRTEFTNTHAEKTQI